MELLTNISILENNFHFPDQNVLFQDDNALLHRARNVVNHKALNNNTVPYHYASAKVAFLHPSKLQYQKFKCHMIGHC